MAGSADTDARLVVAIPTAGRPEIVADTVRAIAAQSRQPDLVLVSLSDPADAGTLDPALLPFALRIVTGPRGLTRQRNRVLDETLPGDILLFLDDDFLMAPDYLERLAQVFAAEPEAVLATGTLIADGILGPGLDHAAGARLLAEGLERPADPRLYPTHTGYGCNFALRMGPVLAHGLRFDERLPLYGWLEDVDFSGRLQRLGRFVRPGDMRGVHLGTKQGRTPGARLGYSQIANPVYLTRKGSIHPRRARRLMLRNMAANLRGTLLPQPWTDHRGRLRGNLLALRDCLTGRIDPERVLNLQAQAAATRPAAAPSAAR